MKITKEFLKSLKPCTDGYEWWCEKFCEETTLGEFVKSCNEEWAYTRWLAVRCLTHRSRVQFAVWCAAQVVHLCADIVEAQKAIDAAKEWLAHPSEKNMVVAAQAADKVNAAAYAAGNAVAFSVYSSMAAANAAASTAADAAAYAAGAAADAAADAADAADIAADYAENANDFKEKSMDYLLTLETIEGMKITKQFLQSLKPCEDGYAWWCKRYGEECTLAEFVKSIDEEWDYCRWLAVRCLTHVSQVKFAVWCAEQVVHLTNVEAAQKAIDSTKRWIEDPSEENRVAAGHAAYAAAAGSGGNVAYLASNAALAALDAATSAANAANAADYAAAYSPDDFEAKAMKYLLTLETIGEIK